jgi:predicted nucleic acid-binding protein
MLVFSDTSPISCLASLQRLDLLDAYGSVRITQAVKNELERFRFMSLRIRRR